jgi:hypothetical protein
VLQDAKGGAVVELGTARAAFEEQFCVYCLCSECTTFERNISLFERKFYVEIVYIYTVERPYRHKTWETFIVKISVAVISV